MIGSERELFSLVKAAPQDPAGFHAACSRVEDWDKLVDCAVEHGVAGVVQVEARKVGFTMPADVVRKLEWRLAIESLRWQMLRAAGTKVLHTLELAGIRAVSLKGTILGERLYEEGSLRPTSDIDVLVAGEDCEHAIEALVAVGWQWEDGPSHRYHRRHHQHVMLRQPNCLLVEIHFRALVGFGIVFPSEDLLSRALPYQSGDDAIWILCPEDEVLYLALHAAGHLFGRLGWLYDIKLLLLKNPRISWEGISDRANSLRVRRALAFTLRRLHDLGAPVPTEMLGTPRALERVAEQVRLVTIQKPEHSPWSTTGSLVFHALLCPDVAAAVRWLAHGIRHVVRRRAQRYFPGLVPAEWSG